MRSIGKIFIFLLSFSALKAQVEIIPTDPTKHLTQSSVIKSNVVVTAREDYMIKSNDACNTITVCNLPGPLGYQNYLYRVDTALQYLLSSSFPTYNNKIYKTTDGGNNWTLKIDTSGLILQHIRFFDSLEGIAFGTYGTYAALARTKDGGNSWASLLTTALPGMITTIQLFGDSTICLGGADGPTGSIIISKDRGHTWPLANGGFSNSQPTGLFFLNKDTIMGVSSFGLNGSPSYFTKTFNGGATWKNIAIDNYTYFGMHFKNSKEGYIVGMNSLNEGIILKTTDLGQNWQTFNTHLKTQLATINFLNDSIALISGSYGVLFKWNSKQTIFTGLDERSISNSGISIFPNPVKDKLSFEFDNALTGDLKLTLSNTLGQIVYSKNNFDLKEELDLSFLKAGIYYLSLRQARGGSDTSQKVFKIVKE